MPFAIEPQTGEPARRLYFKDEIPNAGSAAAPAQFEDKQQRKQRSAKQ